ncbi:hypothetical protein H0H93_009117 [Arthromyces matolae]|nr:hypothetical protein H0H93_009117 [Arthromyces matolae]
MCFGITDGNNWGCIYDNIMQIQDAYSKGHQLGSHTWTHPDMATLDWDELNNEMWLSEPYGSYNDLVIQVAGTRNQTLVTWDFDSGDSVGKTAEESMQLYDDLVSDHPNSILALNHEVYGQSNPMNHTVLPHAIQVLQQAGYQLVTLAECLNVQPYLLTGQPAADVSS